MMKTTTVSNEGLQDDDEDLHSSEASLMSTNSQKLFDTIPKKENIDTEPVPRDDETS